MYVCACVSVWESLHIDIIIVLASDDDALS